MQNRTIFMALLLVGILLTVAGIASATSATIDSRLDALPLHGTPDPNATPHHDDDLVDGTFTYYGDVEPILAANCTSCHVEGQIGYGAFPMDDAATLTDFETAEYIAFVTGIRYMPPWPPSEQSAPMLHERSLTRTEIATIAQWVEQGAPAGDESERQTGTIETDYPEIRPDVVLQLPEYTAAGSVLDDYRCFLVDPGFTEDTYITGAHLVAGNDEIAHHALYFIVNESAVAEGQRRDGQGGRPGWTCYGGTGLRSAAGGGDEDDPDAIIHALDAQGVSLDAFVEVMTTWESENDGKEPDLDDFREIAADLGIDFRLLLQDLNVNIASLSGMSGYAGGWVPGAVPLLAPNNTGILVPAGSQVVVQMHYNLYNGVASDQSTLILQTAAVTDDMTAIEAVAQVAPVEIPCPDGMTGGDCRRVEGRGGFSDDLLAACDQYLDTYADNTGTLAYGYCDYPMTADVWLLGVGPHMHELGKSARVVLNPGTPEETVLIDIPEWDFHWQGQYQFNPPFALSRGDVIRLECWWDNSDGDRYVLWGEGTQDEMCFNFTRILPREADRTLADYGFDID